MKIKIILIAFVAGSVLLSSVVFGQTLQITGTVTAVTTSQITLQSGTDTWTINRTAGTSVLNGTLTAGSTVTVRCISPDAQKKELPANQPTPTPAGS
jgi:hypothetical protein